MAASIVAGRDGGLGSSLGSFESGTKPGLDVDLNDGRQDDRYGRRRLFLDTLLPYSGGLSGAVGEKSG